MTQYTFSLLVVLLATLFCCCSAGGDACTFTNNLGASGTATSPASVQACFDAIPFSESYRDNTVKVLRDVFSLYSFSDIATDSGSPFFLKVDVFAELDRIEKATYANDYAMVVDIQKVFKQLYDAHTEYVAPAPYKGWFTLRPFIFSVSLGSDNGMEFKVASEYSLGSYSFSSVHSSAYGTDPSTQIAASIGKVVTHINGLPILDVLQEFADNNGQYKSPGVRLNSILKGDFAMGSSATAPFLNLKNDTYTFSDSTSLTVAIPAACLEVSWTDVASFQALIPRSVTRREETQQRHFKRNRPELPYMVELRRWLETLKEEDKALERSSAPRSSLQVLNTSMEGAVVASVITFNSQDYVVLQITSLAPTTNQSKEWLLSFQETVKIAVDYGEANSIANLIVDLSGNGGGYICLSPNLLRVLFPGYASTTAFTPSYDVRLSGGYNSSYYIIGQTVTDSWVEVCGADVKPKNGSGWYEPVVAHTRGGKTSLYTNSEMFAKDCFSNNDELPFQWSDPNGLNWSPSYFFQRIIAVTDGTCGSSCSQFLSRAMSDNTVYTVSYGGRLDDTMDTSSFAGGNVENWTPFVETINQYSSVTNITLTDLPTTAETKFNWMEFYASGATLPREFTSLPANAHLNIWPYSDGVIIDELYGQVVTYFSKASDLPSTIECNKAKPGDSSGSSSPASRLSVPFWAQWLL